MKSMIGSGRLCLWASLIPFVTCEIMAWADSS